MFDMRKSCLGCVQKHIGSASVLENEIHNGYPHYGPYLWGELEQASQEAYGANRELAKVLRQHRVHAQYMDEYSIPFDALIEFTYALIALENDGDDTNAIRVPRSCLEGIQKDDDGNPVFDEDTRQ